MKDESLGNRIKNLRKAKSLSQEKLADKAELSQQHISRIEKGITYPGVATLTKIANVLNIPLDDLVDNEVKDREDRYTFDILSLIKRNAWKKGENDKIIMRCSNKECEGYKVLTKQIDIEAYIKNIFARVIENEEILDAPPPDVCELSKDDNMIKMTNELRFMMQDQNVAESDIIKSIQEIASERFNAYTSSDNTVVTELIKEKIFESKAQSRIKAETIGEVVQRILLAPDRTVTVKLKNGIEFVERME